MAKKKANKIGLFDLLMMLMALVGLALAVVGICIPFFQLNFADGSTGMGLFEEGLAEGSDFPLAGFCNYLHCIHGDCGGAGDPRKTWRDQVQRIFQAHSCDCDHRVCGACDYLCRDICGAV